MIFWCLGQHTQAEHNQNMISFLKRCLEIELKLNASKVRLNCTEVLFFGQRVSAQGIKSDLDKVKAIKESFLRSVNCLSRFIPEVSCLRTLLQPLVMNNTDFLWLQSHSDAFDKIKCAISGDCLWQFYDAPHPILIECDASRKGLGCVLFSLWTRA